MEVVLGILLILFVIGLVINIVKWLWSHLLHIIGFIVGLVTLFYIGKFIISYPKLLIPISIILLLYLLTNGARKAKKKRKVEEAINYLGAGTVKQISSKANVSIGTTQQFLQELVLEGKVEDIQLKEGGILYKSLVNEPGIGTNLVQHIIEL